MAKKGPCSHCRINSTPLWRNGPAEKPVLCNACGSRFKLKGTLKNYLPINVQLRILNLKKVNGRRSNLNITGRIKRNLWNFKIPTRRRSLVVYKRMTPMEKLHKQLLSLWRCHMPPNESSSDEILLLDNMNNFISKNEIGLGVIILETDDSTSKHKGLSTCTSTSVDNQVKCESASVA